MTLNETQQAEQAIMQLANMEYKVTPKFCVQCKHYRLAREQPAGSEHRCNRGIFDLVTGKETKMDAICSMERKPTIFDPSVTEIVCGRGAQFFEPMGA
jgi:hypothetical protein